MTRSAAFLGGVGLFLSASAGLASSPGQHLSGVAGIPVEGHEIVAIFDVQGSKHIDWKTVEARFPAEDIRVRLGRPLDSGTICRIKELVRDVLAEKGFTSPEVTHDTIPLPPNRFSPNALRLTIHIVDGPRSRAIKRSGFLSPSQRCSR